MKRKLHGLLMCVLSFASILSYAQNVDVKGRVSGSNGEAIYGVNIVVKGSNQGTVTNDKGDYSINVKKEQR